MKCHQATSVGCLLTKTEHNAYRPGTLTADIGAGVLTTATGCDAVLEQGLSSTTAQLAGLVPQALGASPLKCTARHTTRKQTK